MASKFRQEMPPQGGFGPIEWARKHGRPKMGGLATFGLMGGVGAIAYIHFRYEKKKVRAADFQLREGRIALEPLLLAERNRLQLKTLVKNRIEEKELMKDVEGWDVGTLYGKPVFYNKKRYPHVSFLEYYMHQPDKELRNRQDEKFKH